jgi:hypothetical protein
VRSCRAVRVPQPVPPGLFFDFPHATVARPERVTKSSL